MAVLFFDIDSLPTTIFGLTTEVWFRDHIPRYMVSPGSRQKPPKKIAWSVFSFDCSTAKAIKCYFATIKPFANHCQRRQKGQESIHTNHTPERQPFYTFAVFSRRGPDHESPAVYQHLGHVIRRICLFPEIHELCKCASKWDLDENLVCLFDCGLVKSIYVENKQPKMSSWALKVKCTLLKELM
jgi:hypothetical protein